MDNIDRSPLHPNILSAVVAKKFWGKTDLTGNLDVVKNNKKSY